MPLVISLPYNYGTIRVFQAPNYITVRPGHSQKVDAVARGHGDPRKVTICDPHGNLGWGRAERKVLAGG